MWDYDNYINICILVVFIMVGEDCVRCQALSGNLIKGEYVFLGIVLIILVYYVWRYFKKKVKE